MILIIVLAIVVIGCIWSMVDAPDERYTELDQEGRDYPMKPWEED